MTRLTLCRHFQFDVLGRISIASVPDYLISIYFEMQENGAVDKSRNNCPHSVFMEIDQTSD